jgi:hypothetical protein
MYIMYWKPFYLQYIRNPWVQDMKLWNLQDFKWDLRLSPHDVTAHDTNINMQDFKLMKM